MAGHRRFFVEAEAIDGESVSLTGAVAHQVKNVLRLSGGDHITLLDNSGWHYDVELAEIREGRLTGVVQAKALVGTEPRTKVALYQGLLRAAQFEVVLQKATEIGVSTIVPTICQRCIVANLEEAGERKLVRWERIITEAAEQSGRGKIPALRPVTMLEQSLEQARGLSLLPWEEEQSLTVAAALDKDVRTREGSGQVRGNVGPPFSVNVFIGPEGGFTPAEVATAKAYGITPVTLGPRLLRSETAALVATALVLHATGDLDKR